MQHTNFLCPYHILVLSMQWKNILHRFPGRRTFHLVLSMHFILTHSIPLHCTRSTLIHQFQSFFDSSLQLPYQISVIQQAVYNLQDLTVICNTVTNSFSFTNFPVFLVTNLMTSITAVPSWKNQDSTMPLMPIVQMSAMSVSVCPGGQQAWLLQVLLCSSTA